MPPPGGPVGAPPVAPDVEPRDNALHSYHPGDQAIPGTLEQWRDQTGRTFTIIVTGAANNGPIWGGADNVYSDDSDVATAAVHAGILRPGERGAVTVTILPDRGSYEGTTRNGVESRSWGAWHGSYRIAPAEAKVGAGPPAGAGGPARF